MIKSINENIEQRACYFWNYKENKMDKCFLFFGCENKKYFLLMKTKKGNFDYKIKETKDSLVYKIKKKKKEIEVGIIDSFFSFLDREINESSGLADRFLSGLI